MPVIILIIVDLPAPFGPRYPTASPASIANVTSLTAATSVYWRVKNVLIAPPNPENRLCWRKRFTVCWA